MSVRCALPFSFGSLELSWEPSVPGYNPLREALRCMKFIHASFLSAALRSRPYDLYLLLNLQDGIRRLHCFSVKAVLRNLLGTCAVVP